MSAVSGGHSDPTNPPLIMSLKEKGWEKETLRSYGINSKEDFFKEFSKSLIENSSSGISCEEPLKQLGRNWRNLQLENLKLDDVNTFIQKIQNDLLQVTIEKPMQPTIEDPDGIFVKIICSINLDASNVLDALKRLFNDYGPINDDVTELWMIHALMRYKIEPDYGIIDTLAENGVKVTMPALKLANEYAYSDSKYEPLVKKLIDIGKIPFKNQLFPVIQSSSNISDANINLDQILHQINSPGLKPYLNACKNGETDHIEQFLQNFDPAIRSMLPRPSLLAAYGGAKINVIDTLKQKYHDYPNPLNISELFAAIIGDQKSILGDIINKYPEQIDQIFDELTPLMFATMLGKYEIVKQLINSGADVNKIDNEGHDAYAYSRAFSSENHKQISQLLSKQGSMMIPITKIKSVSHVLELRGKADIGVTATGEGLSIPLEGNSPVLIFRKVLKSTKAMQELTQETSSKKILGSIIEALEFSMNNNNPEDLIRRIKENLPTIISTGFKDHAVASLFWGDFFLHCDTSQASRPIFVFRYDRTKNIETTIKGLLDHRSKDLNSYAETIENAYTDLKFKRSETEMSMEREIKVERQTVGNCTWKSLEGIVKALIYLSTTNTGDNSQSSDLQSDINLNIEKGSQIFNEWLLFTKAYLIEDYMNTKTESGVLKKKGGKNYQISIIPSIAQAAHDYLVNQLKETTIDPSIKEKIEKIKESIRSLERSDLG